MKIRSGFVSNSSSSSFVVIDSGNIVYPQLSSPLVISKMFDLGQDEFGWQEEQYWDFYSKFNFAYLQAWYLSNPNYMEWSGQVPTDKYLDMLERVVYNFTGCHIVRDLVDPTELRDEIGRYRYSHIDHQSASYEGENMEMFEDEQTLHDFLFSNNSYIQTGNDNG